MPSRLPRRVVSGGQTGVDRAALDVALELAIPHGGWCPRGRLAEDGTIPPRYELRETESAVYAERTERNVVDSDGTLIVTHGAPTGGTALTCRLAEQHGKPLLITDLSADPSPNRVRAWMKEAGIATLNVAGPRESGRPGIHDQAVAFLRAVFRADQEV